MEISENSDFNSEKVRRKPVQTDLKHSSEIYKLLVAAVEDYAIFALDPKGIILTWNLGAERLKGYRPEEVIGTSFTRFYSQKDIDNHHPESELLIAAEKGKYEEEGWRIRKDGSQFWANIVITALRDENGALLGFGKVTRDLTGRKRAETILRESEERFRLMVESVPDYAIFMLDPKGNIATWNKGAERNKGYKAEEIIGRHFSTFYPPEDIKSEKPARELREAVNGGRFEEEGWRIRKDGSRFWASVVITPIFDKVGELRGFAKVTRDLTERKIAEDELRAAYSDLEKRVEDRTRELSAAKARAEEAVTARDRFFSIASHELKTPLSSLKLQTQIRLRKVAKGDFSDFTTDRIAELCADDEKQIGRLSFLVDNMLDISKLTAGSFQLSFSDDVDLGELVQSAIKRMQPILDSAGNTVTFSANQHVRGRWDSHRLEQVITNLLSNAAKYAPGKLVEVTVDGEPNRARITVTDHGSGIAKKDGARVFQPFERASNDINVSGLGLGLYIIKQIVDAHGGTIRLKSEIDKGSSFIVELPVNFDSGGR